jgi:hypothetical protein
VDRADIYRAINDERDRQDALKAQGKFPYTLADACPIPGYKTRAFMEEVSEAVEAGIVAQCGGSLEAFREELIQVAACAVAWVEALERMMED